MSLDLTDFENQMVLRPLTEDDYDAVVALQAKCFPGMEPWTKAEFVSQIRTFPQGQVALVFEDALVASSASLIINYDDYAELHDWRTIADNGYITNHNPDGDTLYGIEMQVDPAYRGRKLARRMYAARKELCRDLGLARMIIGGRIPGYAEHKETLTPRQYVEAVTQGRMHDSVLTAQLANGFMLKALVPDYFASDEDSAGYATELEWVNLDYEARRPRGRGRRAVHTTRVATVQYEMRRVESFDDFAQQAEFFVDTASDYKADFVLFPELFTLQLLTVIQSERPGQAARALAEFTPAYLDLFTDLALRYNINIIGGSQFTVEDGHLFNVAYLFRRDGTLGRQKKIHVTPAEARWWGVQGGDKVEVFETDCGPIGIVICYDIEFPEQVRLLADVGVPLLFVPYNTADRHGHLRVTTCAKARCIENHLYVVTAGCVGNLPFTENADVHYARSGVYTPSDVSFARDGEAALADAGLETVLVHDLDLELVRRQRLRGTTTNWRDRRSDLYKVVWTAADGTKREV